jgi:hypothetical protein
MGHAEDDRDLVIYDLKERLLAAQKSRDSLRDEYENEIRNLRNAHEREVGYLYEVIDAYQKKSKSA